MVCSTAVESCDSNTPLACDPYLPGELWPSASYADISAAMDRHLTSRQSEVARTYGDISVPAYRTYMDPAYSLFTC